MQSRFNFRCDCGVIWSRVWIEALHDLSVAADQELFESPQDVAFDFASDPVAF